MKIIGKTLEGDLIIQVSQAEWDGLRDDLKIKDNWAAFTQIWSKIEAYEILEKFGSRKGLIQAAFRSGEFDGSIQSLRDIADGKISARGISPSIRAKLKTLLDNHTAQGEKE